MANDEVVSDGTTNEIKLCGIPTFGRDCKGGPRLYIRRYPATIILVGLVLTAAGAVVMGVTFYTYNILIAGGVMTTIGFAFYFLRYYQLRSASRAQGQNRNEVARADYYPNRVTPAGDSVNGTNLYHTPESNRQSSAWVYPRQATPTQQPTATAYPVEDVNPSPQYGFQPAPYTYSRAATAEPPADPPPSYDSVVSPYGR
ncbi:uncharacterized protein [Ptychodera flava]|uniref:uncharacterized protein n=1 Tax=Ptychodera flava TaxID=63121 RepID=UPI00396A0AA4